MLGKRRHDRVEGENATSPSKRSKAHESTTSISGKINKVVLKNFLNHNHLAVTFEDIPNFVTGTNGSGKSAILQGICLAFGYNPSNVGRNSKLTEFINKDRPNSDAIITVSLNNIGANAYRHDEFGDEVVIERRIGANGKAHSWKLYNANGITMSTKKAEVKKVWDCFNLHYNPCMILMQDAAKRLLSSSAAEKYNFFMSGTGLKGLEDKLHLAQEQLNDLSERDLPTLIMNVEKMKHQLAILREEVKAVQEFRALDVKIINYERWYTWTVVHEKKQRIESLEQTIGGLEEQVADIDKKIQSCRDKYDTSYSARNNILREISDDIMPEKNRLAKAFKKKNDVLVGMKKEISKQQIDKRRTEIRKLQSKKKAVSLKIEEINRRAGGLTAADQKKLDAANAAANEGEVKVPELQENIQELKREQVELKRQQRDYDGLRREIEKRQEALRRAIASKKDPLQRYGSKMPEFVRRIEQQRSAFSQMPVGPLGDQIAVKDPFWTNAVESHIHPSLNYFVVANSRDSQILERILSQLARNDRDLGRVSIISSSAFFSGSQQVYTPNNRLPATPDFIPMMDMIDAPPAVINILMDHMKIHKQVLVKDLRLGGKAVQGQYRDTIANAFEPNGARSFAKGQSLTRFTKDRGGSQILSIGSSADTEGQAQAEIAQLQERLHNEFPNGAQLHSEIQAISNELRRKESNLRSLQEDIRGAKRTIETIMAKISDSNADTDDLQQSIEEFEETIERNQAEIDELVQEMTKLKEAYALEEPDLARAKQAVDAQDRIIEEAELKAKKLSSKLAKLEAVQARFQQQVDLARKAVSNRNDEKNEEEKTYAILLAQAQENAPGGDTEFEYGEKSSHRISKELEAMRVQYEEGKKGHRDYAVVMNEYTLSKQNLETLVTKVKQYSEYSDASKTIVTDRVQKADMLRESFKHHIKIVFQRTVAELKGFQGTIEFLDQDDTKVPKLEVSVVVQDNQANTASLSGGESSFTTVCFLVSMWNVMDCPIVAMDEFDVYMDNQNRSRVLNLLMDLAALSSERQYIFLTPHSLDIIKDRNINVHTLRARPRVNN